MDPHVVEEQVMVKIDVIQPQQGQHAGKGAGAMGVEVTVSTLKMGVKQPGGQSPGPLVEIAEHNPIA